jgi:hypothetical protein
MGNLRYLLFWYSENFSSEGISACGADPMLGVRRVGFPDRSVFLVASTVFARAWRHWKHHGDPYEGGRDSHASL